MFESFQHMIGGFGVATSAHNLFYCLMGAIVGTIVGVLPGLGPIAGIALLIPATFGLNATSAIIMLAGIYYGAMYGGSTTSILLNVPGETASVITCIDGYQMAQKGRAGKALAICAIGSFIAGTLGVLGLVFLAPPLAEAALAFGPPEYFSLMVFGFIILSNVTGTSLVPKQARMGRQITVDAGSQKAGRTCCKLVRLAPTEGILLLPRFGSPC